jgi:hypothetical protein
VNPYPECPDGRADCRFRDGGGISTSMYSPIEYDRSGVPVAGGMNRTTWNISCSVCQKRWHETRSDLERAQGKLRTWEQTA